VIRQGGTDVVSPTVLGDIVNSSPMYVQETETIFVGANDGMLHAFDAVTGVEKFAYVPRGINLANLATISDPNYVHRYFVDGPVAVSSTSQTPGKHYLVGSLGRGGKGIFGLDVTTPDAFADDDVLWEYQGDGDMGQVLGDPLIVTLNDGTKAVLVSNGINSTSGTAALYVINLATGALIRKINTGITGDNGLSAPRGWDNDNNGTVDYVYAGDLKGNLWKFDFSTNDPAAYGVAFSGQPMFQARDDDGVAQPITAGLALAREPISGRRWVFVGTGSFITDGDVLDDDIQSVYGIIDSGARVDGRDETGDGDLQERSIVVTGTSASKAVRGFEENGPLEAGKLGWYIDLDNPTDGERVVTNPRVRGTVLLFASMIPPTNNTCDAGGSGYVNALDAFTGTSLKQPFFNVNGQNGFDDDKLNDPTSPDGDPDPTVPIGSVDLGVGMPTLPTVIDKLLVVGGSGGTIGSIQVNPQGAGFRRISWREIRRD
jgi:type IV pilus assembly protein PilY1